MENRVSSKCSLCEFRGCDADWCRHGSMLSDLGYRVCAFTGRKFEEDFLRALAADPIRAALIFAPGVYEPPAGQVESRLRHELTVVYGFQVSATLTVESIAQLQDTAHMDFGYGYSPQLLPGAPQSLHQAAQALCETAGFRFINPARSLQPSTLLVRGRQFQGGMGPVPTGIRVNLSYFPERAIAAPV